MASQFTQVDPRILRLPRERAQGADPAKLLRQIAQHGKSTQGMAPPWVSRSKDDELMIMDGVTRATRIAKLLPGTPITVEITEDQPKEDYSHLPTVGDMLP
jgi:hypothetical protein